MAERKLPHWDLSPIYPGPESEKFENDIKRCFELIEKLLEIKLSLGVIFKSADLSYFGEYSNTALGELVMYQTIVVRSLTAANNDLTLCGDNDSRALVYGSESAVVAHDSNLEQVREAYDEIDVRLCHFFTQSLNSH